MTSGPFSDCEMKMTIEPALEVGLDEGMLGRLARSAATVAAAAGNEAAGVATSSCVSSVSVNAIAKRAEERRIACGRAAVTTHDVAFCMNASFLRIAYSFIRNEWVDAFSSIILRCEDVASYIHDLYRGRTLLQHAILLRSDGIALQLVDAGWDCAAVVQPSTLMLQIWDMYIPGFGCVTCTGMTCAAVIARRAAVEAYVNGDVPPALEALCRRAHVLVPPKATWPHGAFCVACFAALSIGVQETCTLPCGHHMCMACATVRQEAWCANCSAPTKLPMDARVIVCGKAVKVPLLSTTVIQFARMIHDAVAEAAVVPGILPGVTYCKLGRKKWSENIFTPTYAHKTLFEVGMRHRSDVHWQPLFAVTHEEVRRDQHDMGASWDMLSTEWGR